MSDKATKAIANILVKGVELGLMSWAAVVTSGFLRWALLGYVILVVVMMAGLAGAYTANMATPKQPRTVNYAERRKGVA